jgi:branched-chain amino acid transport system substrate-binding protein
MRCTAGSRGNRARVGVAIALSLSIGVASCSSSSSSSEGSASGSSVATAGGKGAATTTKEQKCVASSPTEGITDTEIKIGASVPQSGLYAPLGVVAKGWQAAIDSANGGGGVKGRKVTVVSKDDAYDFVKTKTNVQELVNDDKVFAIFNVAGTDNNLTIRPDLDKACVPDLYAASPSPVLGNPGTYPWMIGSQPTTATEALVYADYLKKNRPDAKVGILSENDAFGQSYVDAFMTAIDGTQIEVVDNENYDARQTDVSSQVGKLHAAGADVVLLAVNNLTCPTALAAVAAVEGWGPTTFLSNTCDTKVLMARAGAAASGVLSAISLMDPSDPAFAGSDAMKKFTTDGPKYGLSADDLTDPMVGYGWTMGDLLVQTLAASPALDRTTVMHSAYLLDGLVPGLTLPGIKFRTNGVQDPYPVEQLAMARWNVTYFERLGDPVDFDGKTNDYVTDK